MLRGLPGLLLLLLLLLLLVAVLLVVVRLLARLVTVLLHPSMVHFTVQNRSDMLPPEVHKHASVRATPEKKRDANPPFLPSSLPPSLLA
ncbi:hypothetical protein D9C73_004980 [Collichthys lucidus]|uniref:Uncharacterized protein n=1 Tax=Collichthys lucidus TaxID=240159 RepID=A0A4U5UC45_COLLU|nr:hypothetical protein D9C73_004980 [Collichthys lucidus]